jgi:uncharacterized repeat protein (TIGR03803 family)
MKSNRFWTAVSKALAAVTVMLIATLVLASDVGAASKNPSKTLHVFNNVSGGSFPYGNLTPDTDGNLYGTTEAGGAYGYGVVFKLMPKPNGTWTESVLHSFSGADGAGPYAGLILDEAGNLYGTTVAGGGSPTCPYEIEFSGCGVAFKLTLNSDGNWTETILHSFTGELDGSAPFAGLIFDAAGNLYGTTYAGGIYYYGTVFKLAPSADGSWIESTLYSFTGIGDGAHPRAGVIFDAAGNLYGTTTEGGLGRANGGCGSAFKLAPNPDGAWSGRELYGFTCDLDGSNPVAGLTLDTAGNLYGTTPQGGAYDDGVVFELTPNMEGGWSESVLHSFTGADGANPYAGLIFDTAGNLYGTTLAGGAGYGVVFKLTHHPCGTWTERVLHRFTDTPGAYPSAGVILNKAGNIYGTTQGDGTKTFGDVFEIVR